MEPLRVIVPPICPVVGGLVITGVGSSYPVQMDPPSTTADSFVPSDDEAMDVQLRLPAPVRPVQVAPESAEV